MDKTYCIEWLKWEISETHDIKIGCLGTIGQEFVFFNCYHFNEHIIYFKHLSKSFRILQPAEYESKLNLTVKLMFLLKDIMFPNTSSLWLICFTLEIEIEIDRLTAKNKFKIILDSYRSYNRTWAWAPFIATSWDTFCGWDITEKHCT